MVWSRQKLIWLFVLEPWASLLVWKSVYLNVSTETQVRIFNILNHDSLMCVTVNSSLSLWFVFHRWKTIITSRIASLNHFPFPDETFSIKQDLSSSHRSAEQTFIEFITTQGIAQNQHVRMTNSSYLVFTTHSIYCVLFFRVYAYCPIWIALEDF